MVYNNVLEFFNSYFYKLKFDKHLIKQLRNFRLRWSTKDDEYIEFLGSNLIGVHAIRFSKLDDEALMSIYHISDIVKFQKDFYNVEGIDKNHKIGSNVIYHTLVYTAYRFLINKELSEKDKEAGIKEACLIMEYRMFSSLYSHYFKYSVDENTALAVYEKLSHKFLIKKLGSWQDVFEYRAKDCTDKKATNRIKLLNYNTKNAELIVNDIQTKLRSLLNSIYEVLVEVVKNKSAIQTESSTYVGGEKDEKQVSFKDNQSKYTNILQQISYNPNDFIIMDLVKVVDSLFTNTNQDLLLKMLRCMTNEEKNPPKQYFKIIEKVVSVSLDYLQKMNINIEDRSNIPRALVLIKNYWSGSKVKNRNIDIVKRYLQKKAKICSGKKTKWIISSLTIAFIVYLFLRMLKTSD